MYPLRILFYSNWLLIFSWIDLVFKLLSPIFLIRVLGYSGFFLVSVGIIDYINSRKKKWWPVWWWLTVVGASGLGVLVDSKSAMVLALPAIIYFMVLGINTKKITQNFVFFGLILLDFILK